MEQIITNPVQPRTDAEYEAAIMALFDEIDKADIRIEQHQREISGPKTETRAILDELSRTRRHA